jgi:hypothetical protein
MITRENVSRLRSARSLVIAVIVLAGIVGVWLLGEHTPTGFVAATLAIGGAGVVALSATRRPAVAFGVLFLLASLSGWTIATKLGNMRLEQPAIAAGLVAMLYAHRLPDAPTWRRLLPIAIAFMVYLGALTASSLLYAPDLADSLRMTFWIGLSIAGGLLAFLLLLGEVSEGGARGLRLTAAGQASVGMAVAMIFFALGPVVFPGARPMLGLGDRKVFGLAWEANIYASLLAALSLFAIERFRSRPRPASAALVVLALLGMAVGLTRGAYLGLAAGLIVYAFVFLYRRQRARSLLLPASVVIGAIVVGALVAPALLNLNRPPNKPMDLTTAGWGRGLAIGPYLLPGLPNLAGQPVQSGAGDTSLPVGSPKPTTSNPAPQPSSSAAPTPSSSAAPKPSSSAAPKPNPDSIQLRLNVIPVAVEDWGRDPIIGLGADSFDQRHQDHIAILAVAALYESGVVGFAGLTIGFALVLLALWRASRRSAAGPMSAAYLGSLVCLLVAYQATNAINFAEIWLLAGAGLAMAFGGATDRTGASE